jgi:4-nitrophenyl phosphatase
MPERTNSGMFFGLIAYNYLFDRTTWKILSLQHNLRKPSMPANNPPPTQFSSIRSVILDIDGVLWRDTDPIGDLPAIFRRIDEYGWHAMLATNNATRPGWQFLEKLAGFGVQLEDWQIVNSSQATAHYLKRRYPQGGCVYIIGEEGIRKDIESQGFSFGEQHVLAAVIGLDRQLTYDKLKTATLLIRSGADFIATNPDKTLPTPAGLVPGAGAIVAAIQTATDVEPYFVGKPAPVLYELALERLGTSPDATLVVGDRLETDILGGQRLGCRTALVLSGATTAQMAAEWVPAPDFIALDLADLFGIG